MPRNILLAAHLPAPPSRLYDMYHDAGLHAEFTGMPVKMDPRPGGAFSAFGGAISGTTLHVEPKRVIVQRWRASHWPKRAVDSILVLSFWEQDGEGRVELAHINVADEDFTGVSQGWEKYYWTPWREYLERAASAKTASPRRAKATAGRGRGRGGGMA
jgi:uncharacterized protein YndB with AHSA1/START domain